jgi:SAM-dependent methyltransferase
VLRTIEQASDEAGEVQTHACRLCGARLSHTFVDLGMSPLCESFLTAGQLDEVEPFYPLHVWICGECLLVQLAAYVPAEEIFRDYAYFSSYSDSWVAHAARYTDTISKRLGLDETSLVLELGSNDGYLLQYFIRKGIPAFGIDPAGNVVVEARARGVETIVDFFDSRLARQLVEEGRRADLVVANNVLAQVPELNDFVAGIEAVLAEHGVVTVEVPHLARLVEGLQYDTIYHEHYSYFSLTTLVRLFGRHGLEVFDVEELPSHGGSLRIYVQRRGDQAQQVQPSVAALLEWEHERAYDTVEGYRDFGRGVAETRWSLLELLIGLRREGKRLAGYGAPGKGNTLLNACGIRTDLLEFTVDRNPHKWGKFLPGTHIPIYPTERMGEERPDYILILPWNLEREIAPQLAYAQEWGARLIVPIPHPRVLPEGGGAS